MKLYYSTHSSSMSCVVAVIASGIDCTLIETSRSRNLNMDELLAVNPLGKTGTLVLDDGRVLTQNLAILEYIAEQSTANPLLAAPGTWERSETLSWLSFGVTDIYSVFTTAFRRKKMLPDENAQQQIFEYAQSILGQYLEQMEKRLSTNKFLAGPRFTIADCFFAFAAPFIEKLVPDVQAYPEVAAYAARLSQVPAVQAARAMQD